MFNYFKDKITQYKNKYNMTINDETTEVTLEKENGTITQEGTALNAYNLNQSFMEFIKYLYPVGSVFVTRTSTNPQEWMEGTRWTRCAIGKTVCGAGTYEDKNGTSKTFNVGSTYGEFTHTMTESEMPMHNHDQYVTANTDGIGIRRSWQSDGSCKIYSQGIRTGSTGSGQPFNIMQPTTPLYFWYRTS